MKRVILQNLMIELEGGTHGTRDIAIRDGVIEAVEAGIAVEVGDDVRDYSGHLAAPGLANCHTHSNENWFRGRFDNLPLEPWMIYSYPTLYGPAPTERDVYLRTLVGAMEAARTGTTCIVDFIYEFTGFTEARLGAMVAAYRDVGIRAQICLAIADRPYSQTVILNDELFPESVRAQLESEPPMGSSESLDLVREMVAKFHDPDNGIYIGLGPSGPQRCTDEMLRGSADLADELDLQIHTHVLETKMQLRSGTELYGKSIVEHLGDIGFLSPRTHLVHGVWLSNNDIDILAATGATVVHNPISNLKLGSGVSPVTELRKRGVSVSLGTDGMCAGDGQNMFEAVKLASILHKVEPVHYSEWIGAHEAWKIATIGGSAATGALGIRGEIKVGQQADILVLDLSDSAFTPLNDPKLHLALQIPTRALSYVYVRGEMIVRDGKLVGVDERALLQEVRERSGSVLDAHADAFAFGDALLPSLAAGWDSVLKWDAPVNSYLR